MHLRSGLWVDGSVQQLFSMFDNLRPNPKDLSNKNRRFKRLCKCLVCTIQLRKSFRSATDFKSFYPSDNVVVTFVFNCLELYELTHKCIFLTLRKHVDCVENSKVVC